MAKQTATDLFILLNAVNLSAAVKSATLAYDGGVVDITAMGAVSRIRLGGIKDWTLTIEFFQDYAASLVDATLFPLVGSTFAVEFRPTSAARSATNPGFTGTGILASYQPVGGSIGDTIMAPVTINGSSALARQTA